MHPFFSNQISKIRSVCIISYPFHTRGSPALPNIGSIIVVCLTGSLFFPLSPFFLIQTVCFPPQRCACQVCQNCFFLCLCSLCIPYTPTYVYLCVSFSLFSHSFLPNAAVMARDESTIGPQHFSED